MSIFVDGYADATIHFIQISDEASYSCDVEIQSLQKEVAFSVKVYREYFRNLLFLLFTLKKAKKEL